MRSLQKCLANCYFLLLQYSYLFIKLGNRKSICDYHLRSIGKSEFYVTGFITFELKFPPLLSSPHAPHCHLKQMNTDDSPLSNSRFTWNQSHLTCFLRPLSYNLKKGSIKISTNLVETNNNM